MAIIKRNLDKSQKVYEDLLFENLFPPFVSTCAMLLTSEEILEDETKSDFHADAERINRRSERCYEELLSIYTDYYGSTLVEPSKRFFEPFQMWSVKLQEVIDTFFDATYKRYVKLLKRLYPEKDEDTLVEEERNRLMNTECWTNLQLWMFALMTYFNVLVAHDNLCSILLDNGDENGNVPAKFRKLETTEEELEQLEEQMLLAMFDFGMTEYELDTPLTEEEETAIAERLSDLTAFVVTRTTAAESQLMPFMP